MGKDNTIIKNNGICGLILAAGYSSRMGSFKPLLPIGDKTAIQRIIETLKEAKIENIIVVTGYNHQLLVSALNRENIKSIYNKDFDKGMFTSIKTGIKYAMSEFLRPDNNVIDKEFENAGFLLFPVDCPLVPSNIITLILEKHKENKDSFIVPCYQGKKGHPLFIPAFYTDEILFYDGEGGLKAITDHHEDKMIRLNVNSETVVLDMDTPESYQELMDFYNKKLNGDNAENIEFNWLDQLKERRLFLIRHGEIKQHKEKIFLGQVDVHLSLKGREQARIAGLELKNYKLETDQIYTSDLSRAYETAEIVADILKDKKKSATESNEVGKENTENNEKKVILRKEPDLREMSLGDWDGYYISEVKEKFPEEYKKRGRNLLTYKNGNNSENFFDLQYRVMKCFKNILIKNDEKDIIIVSHSGVIKVLLSNIYCVDLEREIKENIPNGSITVIDFSNVSPATIKRDSLF